MRQFGFIAAVVLCGTQATADAGGDPEKGAALFQQCSGCHQVGEGAVDRIGPHLNGIFDSVAGDAEGYRFSAGLLRAADGGLVQDRDDLLAYLRVFSDNPRDIPESAPTAVAVDHSVAPEILAIVGDPAYGEYLSGECTSCHQSSGAGDGIPAITNWPTDDFVTAMHAYKEGARAHPVMQMMAGRLSDEEIAALAAYFKDVE